MANDPCIWVVVVKSSRSSSDDKYSYFESNTSSKSHGVLEVVNLSFSLKVERTILMTSRNL